MKAAPATFIKCFYEYEFTNFTSAFGYYLYLYLSLSLYIYMQYMNK